MARGHDRERQVRRLLERGDWWVARAAGSLGDADLVALKPGRRLLIECKTTGQGPYERFGPKARLDLIFAADLAGAEAWLCWWPPRGKPRWLPASEWPKQRTYAHVIPEHEPGSRELVNPEERYDALQRQSNEWSERVRESIDKIAPDQGGVGGGYRAKS